MKEDLSVQYSFMCCFTASPWGCDMLWHYFAPSVAMSRFFSKYIKFCLEKELILQIVENDNILPFKNL